MAYAILEKYVAYDASGGNGDEGSPWTLDEGMLANATAANIRVNVKLGGSDYTKENAPFLVNSDGSIAGNFRLIYRGYKENIGDMDPMDASTGRPGLFFQSALDAHINGIDATKKVKITGSGDPHTILDLGGAKNIDIQNFDFSSADAGVATGSAATGSITNCAFSAGSIGINASASHHLRIMGNFFGTGTGVSGAPSIGAFYGQNVLACVSTGISFPANGSSVFGNIFAGGSRGLFSTKRCNVFNNLFYGQTLVGIETRSEVALTILNEWNNIFSLPELAAFAVKLITTDGSVAFSNRSLAFTLAGNWSEVEEGNPDNHAWYGVDNDENLRGANSLINVNPLLIDPSNKNYKLHDDSPCWNRGMPGVDGVNTHIGPFVREIDPRWRGRRYMYG